MLAQMLRFLAVFTGLLIISALALAQSAVAAELVAPADGAFITDHNVPEFEWRKSTPGEFEHHVKVFSGHPSDGGSVLWEDDTGSGTSAEYGSPGDGWLPDGTYYWRVESYDMDDESEQPRFSTVWKFVIGRPPLSQFRVERQSSGRRQSFHLTATQDSMARLLITWRGRSVLQKTVQSAHWETVDRRVTYSAPCRRTGLHRWTAVASDVYGNAITRAGRFRTPKCPPLRVPYMTAAQARSYARSALQIRFGNSFRYGNAYRRSCVRRSRGRFSCRVRWFIGDLSYAGWVAVHYARSRGARNWYYGLTVVEHNGYSGRTRTIRDSG